MNLAPNRIGWLNVFEDYSILERTYTSIFDDAPQSMAVFLLTWACSATCLQLKLKLMEGKISSNIKLTRICTIDESVYYLV